MSRIFRGRYFVLMLMVISASFSFAQTEPRLHPFYEQNGDCYILIGEGNAKAVWALNNLVSGGTPAVLYDPNDAYGITAAQKWNASLLKSDKDLFTFEGFAVGGSGSGPYPGHKNLAGQLVPRRIVMSATSNVYNFDQIPPATVHRFHGAPNNSPTGRGNHPSGTINALFGGIDYPCSRIPAAVATMPGYYWYPVGTGFYHSFDEVVWSNWTYGGGYRRSTSNPPPASQRYNPRTDGPVPTQGPWAVCCAGRYPSRGWIMGGWVRRMRRENLWGAYRDIKLFKYRVDSGASSSAFDRDVATVLASVIGTVDKNGECCDGCIARVDNEAMPGVPSPHLSCVYSAIVDRSYLYRRDQGKTSFQLNGITGDDQIIGVGNDLTCKYLGISSKSSLGNYVYLLGLNQINQWLDDANAGSMKLNELSDVAVSDQWWQTGGIVYAYDATKGCVYRFVRNENGENGIPAEINVAGDGILPDRIGADGFGSLYLLKTEYEPKDTSSFIDGNEYSKAPNGTISGGIPKFRATYRQNVYKTIYRRDYYEGTIDKLPNRILLGRNIFVRDYVTEDDDINSTKVWVSGFSQMSPIINPTIRTELAVINSPTPPRPGNLDALTDCLGPMVAAPSGFEAATPDENGDLTDDNDYWFMVENAPYFDANEVNLGNIGEDVNSNGRIGQFPNTIHKSSVRYYWKVIQTHDRHGELLSAPATIMDMESEGATGDYLFLFPPGAGKFRVGVKVTYRYYDYRDLPVGAMSSDKGSVLKPGLSEAPLTAAGEDSAGYSWTNVSIKQVPPVISPQDRGVIMSGIFQSEDQTGALKAKFKPGPRALGFGCNNAGFNNENCRHEHCNPANSNLGPTKFILDGYSLNPKGTSQKTDGTFQIDYAPSPAYWALQLRDSNFNLNKGVNRIASMTSEDPPVPDDPSLIPGSVEWAGGLTVTWTSQLKRGNTVIVDKQLSTGQAILSLQQLRQLFPVPSEPASYTLSVDFRRTYRYEIFLEVWRRVGGDLIKEIKPVPRVVNMRIWSDAEILVTDNTPPAQWLFDPYANTADASVNPVAPAFFINRDILYGTTGETLSETDSPPSANPSQIVITVADNNPLANSNFSNNGKDIYHSSVSGVGSRLVVSHEQSNQLATFSYTTVSGEMPPSTGTTGEIAALKKWYSSGNSGLGKLVGSNITDQGQFDAITGTTGLYNKSYSYRSYTISLSDLNHFSREFALDSNNCWTKTGELKGRMAFDRANNATGYKNLSYGLAWQEACYSVINNLRATPVRPGQIVIRDNDRPNAFITASQDKYATSEYFVPNNLHFEQGILPPKWVEFATPGMTDSKFNGPQQWNRDNNSSAFDGKFHKSATGITKILFPSGEDLEVNVPVRFDVLASDNAGHVATISYRLVDSTDNVLIDGIFANNLPMQYVFRKPGLYKVILKVRDNALSWPSNPKAYAPDLLTPEDPGVSNEFNQRDVEAIFNVVPTKLEFRIIEKDRKGR